MNHTTGALILNRLPQMRSYARSLTRNTVAAEDLVQDAIVRVLSSMGQFDGTNFASWSNAILRNRFIDDRRRSRFDGGSIDDLPLGTRAERPIQDIVVELDETLSAIDRLPPMHRDILVMICIKDFTYEHTASLLNIPLGTVRSRLSRARSLLHACCESGQRNRSQLALPLAEAADCLDDRTRA